MPSKPPKKLLDRVRDALRTKHYSYRTEQTYVDWIRRYILFHNKRHPREMGVPEVNAFITRLLQNGGVYPERSRRDIRTTMNYTPVLSLSKGLCYNAVASRSDRP